MGKLMEIKSPWTGPSPKAKAALEAVEVAEAALEAGVVAEVAEADLEAEAGEALEVRDTTYLLPWEGWLLCHLLTVPFLLQDEVASEEAGEEVEITSHKGRKQNSSRPFCPSVCVHWKARTLGFPVTWHCQSLLRTFQACVLPVVPRECSHAVQERCTRCTLLVLTGDS